jgi:hypothetical protein
MPFNADFLGGQERSVARLPKFLTKDLMTSFIHALAWIY